MLWIDKPEVLFDIKRLKYYMPGPNLTWEEQANSLVRFIIYLSLIMYLFNGNPLHLIVPPLMIMGVQYYLQKQGKLQRTLIQIFNSRPTDAEMTPDVPPIPANYDPKAGPHDNIEMPNSIKTNATTGPGIEDQSGPTDDDVIENFDPSKYRTVRRPMDLHKDAEMENEVDRMIAEEMGLAREPKSTIGPRPDMGLLPPEPPFKPKEIECKPATPDNPFGNSLPFDPIERQVTRVCPDEYKKDEMFYTKLFNGVDDLFDRNNSQRQFTTNPASTRINDREAAMQFFYNTPYTEH